MTKNKKFVLVNKFTGEPKNTDFKLVEEDLPEIQDGEVHFQAEFLSVDPYMRPYGNFLPEGVTFCGSQVAKVVESKNSKYKVGDHVVAPFGWQTNYVGDPSKIFTVFRKTEEPMILPDLQGLPISLALGVLGMPGNTAYFGLTEILKPKAGEVIVISGAAGAVGSHVGQIAKILGCTAIGFTGSDDKVQWLRELKFDWAFNYKKDNIVEALKIAAPEGVHCYFDNVGGELSSKILTCMKEFGRIAVCGAISAYNTDPATPLLAPAIQGTMVMKQLKMEGFLVHRWQGSKWFKGMQHNLKLIKENKLSYKEEIFHGFESLPDAFISMLRGDHFGKVVVKV